MRLPHIACLCLALNLALTPKPVSAEEPFGIALEGFSYPYPVRFLSVAWPEGPLNLAYMDARKDAEQGGRVALLLHGRNVRPHATFQVVQPMLLAPAG